MSSKESVGEGGGGGGIEVGEQELPKLKLKETF